MNLIGQYHVVPLLAPQDIGSTGISTDIIKMAKYSHALILLMTGTNTKGCTLTVEKCTTAAPGAAVAMAFNYRKMATSDVWGALIAEDSAGLTIADADDNAVYGIEIASAELSATHPFVRVTLSAPGSGTNYISALAILTPRYGHDVPQSAIV